MPAVTHHRPLQRIGQEKKHARLWITDGAATREAVIWGAADGELRVGKLIVPSVHSSTNFNGTFSIQLKVPDWRTVN